MNKIIIHIALNICLALLAVSTVRAQGWERVLSSKGGEDLYDVVPTPEGGYMAVGQFDALDKIYLVKTYCDGRLQWSRKFGFFNNENCIGRALTIAADGSIYIAGYSDGFGLNFRDIVLLKTDAEGNLLWQKNYGTTNSEEAFDLIPTTDGGLLIGGTRDFNPNKDILLLKIDADGGLVWEKTFGDSQTDEQVNSLTQLPDGGVAIVGSIRFSPVDLDPLVIRTDALGNQTWKETYDLDITSDGQDIGYGSALATDNKLVVAGYTQAFASSLLMKIDLDAPNMISFFKTEFDNVTLEGICNASDGGFLVTGFRDEQSKASLFVAKIDDAGNTVWQGDFGDPGPAPKAGHAVIEAFDGGAIVAGWKQPYVDPPAQYAYMVKTDANGVIFTDQINGNVFHDFNNNCTQDSPEPALQDWIIKITKPDAPDRYAVSDANGFYRTQVDTGTYNVQLFRPNAYWQPCQPDGYSVTLTGFYDTTTVNLPVKAAFACPSMQVDIVTPTLIRCEENRYTVSYCNEGTLPAVNAKISVTLDPKLDFLGSSIPGALDSGTTYSFEIGFVGIGQCGTFTINTFLDCGVEIGETHCVTAHAYPDTFCKMAFPDWDGSILEATGTCENDKVRFKLKNIGTGAMTAKGDFIVIEDVLLLTAPSGTSSFFDELQPQQDTIVWEGVANGATRRIIASQTPGYPGPNYPTAAVEGCKTDTTGNTSLGYFTMFPDDESEPFKASDCQEVLGFNPGTAKIGHPKGFGTDHWITDSTDLEYLIQFQNTGTDTVYSVEIRDTLSKWLDPTTVKAGAGSAPYDFEIYDGGIVLFRIPNTVLYPVGSVGDGPSSGFVHFRVSQKPITPCDTLIINRAAIFLNDQNPVVTNEVTRKVCNDKLHFITVKSVDIEMPGAQVQVFPNPFVEYADFKITGVTAKNYAFELFDVAGKRVLTNSFNHPDFRLHRYQLSPGVFFYRLSADGKPVASGKLIAE